MHIAIAGNIGAGKTTLTKLLARHYNWKPHYESVDENPYLINGMEPFFYTKFLPPIVKFNEENINNKMPNNLLFLTKKYDVFKKIIKKEECKKQYSSFPEKIINLNKNWKNLNYNWYAIYCY